MVQLFKYNTSVTTLLPPPPLPTEVAEGEGNSSRRVGEDPVADLLKTVIVMENKLFGTLSSQQSLKVISSQVLVDPIKFTSACQHTAVGTLPCPLVPGIGSPLGGNQPLAGPHL